MQFKDKELIISGKLTEKIEDNIWKVSNKKGGIYIIEINLFITSINNSSIIITRYKDNYEKIIITGSFVYSILLNDIEEFLKIINIIPE